MMLKISATISGASPSDGSSISRTRGRDISARATASICCSPPESVPANLLAPLAAGAESAHTSARCRRRSRPCRGADRRRRAGSRARSSAGTPAGSPARARRPARRSAPATARRARSPSSRIEPRRGCRMPAIVIISVVLPAPFGPSRQVILPLSTLQRHALQRFDLAVGGDEVGDVEHRVSSRRRRGAEIGLAHRGSACTSAGVPSAIFWPKLSTAMRSATDMTSST